MKKDIILFIPSIEKGGVEKNFFLIANYLIKKYKNIFVVTANSNFKNYFNKKIKVICPKTNKWNNKKRSIKTFVSIILLIKNFFYKKILILSFQSNIPIILISKIFNFNVIIRLNTSIKKYITGIFDKIFYKFHYNLADKIIVNSFHFKNELKLHMNLESNLIYNSIKISSKKNKINFFKNFKGLKIINIGRLTKQKDQITLIKSLNLLFKNKIKFRCCIIGRGIEANNLKNLIDENRLNKNIKLVGYKKEAEKYIKSGNLFILSSKFEGLPNVLIEAQSKNIPIISSDCPTGPREILLGGKLGDLFKVGDYKELYNLIRSFNKNKSKLLNKSKRAKKYLIRFDLETNCKKYEKIISSII